MPYNAVHNAPLNYLEAILQPLAPRTLKPLRGQIMQYWMTHTHFSILAIFTCIYAYTYVYMYTYIYTYSRIWALYYL